MISEQLVLQYIAIVQPIAKIIEDDKKPVKVVRYNTWLITVESSFSFGPLTQISRRSNLHAIEMSHYTFTISH